MPKYFPYRQIGGPNGCLARREEFQGHTMWAQKRIRENPVTSKEFEEYCVFSYDVQIAGVSDRDFLPGDQLALDTPMEDWWVNTSWFSKTTRRHQNMCLAWLPKR